MSTPKKKILIQLDGDSQPSVFDRVVAVDAGADHVFSYGGVEPDAVRDLVYGAIFTRGPDELKNTAIFLGGSNVAKGDELLEKVKGTFFGPMRVSVLADCNGSNTTAAAAVAVAERHVPLQGARALVLGATGAVGRRVTRLLARAGAEVRVSSRQLERARDIQDSVQAIVPAARIEPMGIANQQELELALRDIAIVISAGAPGASLLPLEARERSSQLKVVVDLNAVPPVGIEGVKSQDAGVERHGHIAYGAIGVGGLKMKIHKAAIRRLFESSDAILDAEQVFELGRQLERAR